MGRQKINSPDTAVKVATSRKKAAEPVQVQTTEEKTAVFSRKGSTESKKDADLRKKLVADHFVPETVDYLKENFGIDVTNPKVPVSVVYDIAHGNVTAPIKATITPLVYDAENKCEVEAAKIQTIGSFRFIFPHDEKTFKPIAPDKEHGIYVSSYPCHEYLTKSDGTAQAPEKAPSHELRNFTDEEKRMLETIGIRSERLYYSKTGYRFNALTNEQKYRIQNGLPFEMDGNVRTAAGYINIAGTAKLTASGVLFEPTDVPVKGEDDVLDLLAISKIGNLELKFEQIGEDGTVLKDAKGHPILSRAASDLLKYGIAMEPVKGFMHTYKKGGESVSIPGMYQVSVVNGGLKADLMRQEKVLDLNSKGEPIMVRTKKGETFEKYHYEYYCKEARITKDNEVRLPNGNCVKFASDEDRKNFQMGKGGKVIGAEWKDFSGKDAKPVIYDAFVVPDNRRGGFAKQFSPTVSKALIERNAPKVKKVQNFSLGIS